MSKREYDLMQVIKKHGLKTPEGLDATLTTLGQMVSENGELPTARITAFGKERGLTVGKAFAILIERGLDAFDAERPSAPASDTAAGG